MSMEENLNEKLNENKTEDTVLNGTIVNEQETFTPEDIEANKVMAVMCYIVPLIPYLAEKKSKWVRFHAIQGMNVWLWVIILSCVLTVASTIFSIIPVLGDAFIAILSLAEFLMSMGTLALEVIGIMNVCKGEAKELPLIEKIKIIKK